MVVPLDTERPVRSEHIFEADGRKRLCERKAMAGHVVGAAEPQACASEGTMIRRGSLPLASASSASSVARCSACEVIYARLQFQDLASKPSMLPTVLAMLTDARAFGSFCCRRVLHVGRRFQCPSCA